MQSGAPPSGKIFKKGRPSGNKIDELGLDQIESVPRQRNVARETLDERICVSGAKADSNAHLRRGSLAGGGVFGDSRRNGPIDIDAPVKGQVWAFSARKRRSSASSVGPAAPSAGPSRLPEPDDDDGVVNRRRKRSVDRKRSMIDVDEVA